MTLKRQQMMYPTDDQQISVFLDMWTSDDVDARLLTAEEGSIHQLSDAVHLCLVVLLSRYFKNAALKTEIFDWRHDR